MSDQYRPIWVDVWDVDGEEGGDPLWSGAVPALPDVGHQLSIYGEGADRGPTYWTVTDPPLWVMYPPGGGPPHSVGNVELYVRRAALRTPGESDDQAGVDG